MKAKEFMLNDLVYRKEHEEFHEPVPRSVVRIDGVMDNNMITIAPDSEFLDMDEIEPIPLTAEILEKNGFLRQEEERGFSEPYILYINDDYGYPIKIYPKFYMDKAHHLYIGYGDEGSYLSLYINYFHELQHALRLVRLNEVADNLKV